jgi:hypothetical protein
VLDPGGRSIPFHDGALAGIAVAGGGAEFGRVDYAEGEESVWAVVDLARTDSFLLSGRWLFWDIIGPLNLGTPLPRGAVSQEQINKILIRHPQFGRYLFEVIYRRGIEANGDLSLELLDVRILAGLGKIVFTSHGKLQ